MKQKILNNRGIMMIEIIIAIAIIATSIFASMAVSSQSISSANKAVRLTQASFLLEEGAEAVRIVRDNGWTSISDLTPGALYYPEFSGNSWSMSIANIQIDDFTRTVTVSPVNRDAATNDIASVGVDDPGTKLITVTVSWPEGGENVSKEIKFYISNIFL